MKRLLLIEDEPNLRESLSDILEISGYEVIQAADGETGIGKAFRECPDVILCDINMKGINGYEVLTELRKTDLLDLVPFIFLTAKSSMADLREGMELGADDYLIKPVDHEVLLKSIKAAEKKKAGLINQLGDLQNELNKERLKIRNLDRLNSHEIRRKLSIIQSIFPLIKSGELNLEEGLNIIEESGEEIETTVHQINEILNQGEMDQPADSRDRLSQLTSIWLIDDDATQNLISKVLLKKLDESWDIKDFRDAREALSKLKDNPPDLILLDINMPGMDGFGFLDALSKLKMKVHVIMLSSSISPQDIRRSLGFRQVINYFTKPLKREVLTNFLAKG